MANVVKTSACASCASKHNLKNCDHIIPEIMEGFDFNAGEKLVDVFRRFCESRMPSTGIDELWKLIATFAREYFKKAQGDFTSELMVEDLCFTMLTLSVDLHNPEITNRLTEYQYVTMAREYTGVPEDTLREIYQDIKAKEFKITRPT